MVITGQIDEIIRRIPGSYYIRYDVTDERGFPAEPLIREVRIVEPDASGFIEDEVPLNVPYVIRHGDTLEKIAIKQLGDGQLWPLIYNYIYVDMFGDIKDNKKIIGNNPNAFDAGMRFTYRHNTGFRGSYRIIRVIV